MKARWLSSSYLDPAEISEGLVQSEHFLRLRFFGSAYVTKLLKIVPAGKTVTEVLAIGLTLARRPDVLWANPRPCRNRCA
ncbi:hypothetical protein A9Z06_03855 [Rhizobium sp. YK2]|nr:hypothetical protein A9Z06_03855 [Rhizobium sp. YK2]